MPPLRAYVADDHPLYRGAVVGAIEGCPELELAGTGGDGEEALSDIRRLRPDVALLDVQMPGMDGPEVLRRLVGERSPTRVLLLSGLATAEVASDALGAGARGFLDKQATAQELCAAVAAVARGETVVSPRLRTDGAVSLSPREREVLGLVAEGLSAPAIARRLVLSPHTVKTHVRNLCEKLGVTDRAAAVASAMRRGLL
ncbi:MAG: response regulator transcription factor [Thermoleophilaceae bacterium]